MKPLVAKILIVLCLFSFTPLKEFVKIPVLFVHYYHHIQECPEMTVGEFFDMHYLNGLVFDEDYEQDMQLPFKTFDFTPMPVFVYLDNKAFDIDQKVSSFIIKDKINTSYRFYLSDAKLKGVFHPPKFS